MFHYALKDHPFSYLWGVGEELEFLLCRIVFVRFRVDEFLVLFYILFTWNTGIYIYFFLIRKHPSPHNLSISDNDSFLIVYWIWTHQTWFSFSLICTLNPTSLLLLKFVFNLFVTSILIKSFSLWKQFNEMNVKEVQKQ